MRRPTKTRPKSERRWAVVTGASRGLGAVVTRLLAGERFDLVVVARTPGDLSAIAAEARRFGGRVIEVVGDVAVASTRARVVRSLGDSPGLDLLINNASELGPSPLPPLADVPTEALEQVYRVNVVAPIALVQALLPALERRNGMVVNISSDAALGGYPGWGTYGATKAALDLASLTLAHELKERGVSVVAVDPGDMRTGMHQSAYPGQDISDRPSPEVTLPFWAWLFGQSRAELSGHRFRAQSEHWGASE